MSYTAAELAPILKRANVCVANLGYKAITAKLKGHKDADCLKRKAKFLNAKIDVLKCYSSGVLSGSSLSAAVDLSSLPAIFNSPVTFDIEAGVNIIASQTATYSTLAQLIAGMALAINNNFTTTGFTATNSPTILTVTTTQTNFINIDLTITISSFVVVNPTDIPGGGTYTFPVTVSCNAIVFNEADNSIWLFDDNTAGFSRIQGVAEVEYVPIVDTVLQPTIPAFYNSNNKRVYRNAYSFNGGANCLLVYDANPGSGTYKTIIGQLYSGLNPVVLCINNYTQETYIAINDGANVIIKMIDINDNEVGSISLPLSASLGTTSNGGASDPSTGTTYVVNVTDNFIYVIDGLTRTIVSSITLAGYTLPNSVLFNNNFVYIVATNSTTSNNDLIKCQLDVSFISAYEISVSSILGGQIFANHFGFTDLFQFASIVLTTGANEFTFPYFNPGAIFFLQVISTPSGFYVYIPYQQTPYVLLLQIVDTTFTYTLQAASPNNVVANNGCATDELVQKAIGELKQNCANICGCYLEQPTLLQGTEPAIAGNGGSILGGNNNQGLHA